MMSREEFRKYRSAAHKQEINIHGGTYSDVPFSSTSLKLERNSNMLSTAIDLQIFKN